MNFNIANSRTSKLKYLTVLEFQKRGAVHYHSIFFNLPAGVIEHERITRRIAKIWGNGFIDIESKLDIDGMAIYLTKYMIKGFEDTRLDGKKRYFDSRGLKNPVSILDRRMTDKLVANLSPQDMVYEKTFESEFMGTTTYRKYKVPEDHYALLNLKALARSIL